MGGGCLLDVLVVGMEFCGNIFVVRLIDLAFM